jgi:N-acetyl-anhydromuramyl-L-alanine amidase AmpD
MKIDRETLRLPDEQYYKEESRKRQIYIHHTVGGSARSTFNWWLNDTSKSGGTLKVATAYLIERDGTIYEVFDPKYWAHHLGLKIAANERLNRESIGIELCSEGALVKKSDGKLYCFDGAKFYRDVAVDLGYIWRGYQYFDAYEKKQIDSCIALVVALCEQFNIPKRIPDGDLGRFDLRLLDFDGVLGHCHVRADKTDPHPLFPWGMLSEALKSRRVTS